MATTTLGGKERWTAAPLSLFEASKPLFEEALAPFADDLSWRVESGSDFVVAETGCGVEHDPGSDDVSIRRRISPSHRFECDPLFSCEFDVIRARSRHGPSKMMGGGAKNLRQASDLRQI